MLQRVPERRLYREIISELHDRFSRIVCLQFDSAQIETPFCPILPQIGPLSAQLQPDLALPSPPFPQSKARSCVKEESYVSWHGGWFLP